MILLLSYDTNHSSTSSKGSLQYLLKSAESKKWSYKAIGDGDEWVGFGQKSIAIIDEIPKLIKKYGKDLILIVSDARDVIVNRKPAYFKRTFDKVRYNRNIVFGAEIGCCVYPMKEFPPGTFITRTGRKDKAITSDKYHENKNHNFSDNWVNFMKKNQKKLPKVKEEWFRALNAGMYAGYATSILRMLKRFRPLNLNENDQALWSNAMISFPRTVMLDYNNELFSNANTWDGAKGCFFSYDKKRKSWKNTITKSYPFLIQVPGGHVDNYRCYKKLIDKV